MGLINLIRVVQIYTSLSLSQNNLQWKQNWVKLLIEFELESDFVLVEKMFVSGTLS